MNAPTVRLEQHLCNSRSATKVTVDLKRRMRIEHVWIGSLRRKQHLQDGMSVIALSQSCPQVDAPAHCPSSGLIAANLERSLRSFRQLWRVFDGNLRRWE